MWKRIAQITLPSSMLQEPGRGPKLPSDVGVWDISGGGVIRMAHDIFCRIDLVNGATRDFTAKPYQSTRTMVDLRSAVVRFSRCT